MSNSEAGDAAAAAGMAHSFTQEYFQIPVVTRAYTTACILTTAAVVRTRFSFNPQAADERGNSDVGSSKSTAASDQRWCLLSLLCSDFRLEV